MKKSLLSVIMLFIAWAVSAAAISTPLSAIVRLEDAGSPNSRVHRSYAQVCPVGMQPEMCPTGHGFQTDGIGVLPHAMRLVTLPGHTSAKLRCTRLLNESVSCGHVGDSLEYSAFPGGYFTPKGVFYYITDWQGNNIAVFSDKGELVQQTTYYPYGEPTIEPTGQRYLFGGKEREHAGGRNSYDYGPRNLGPSGNWDSADRKATENYPISPFSYCNGDPINHIDNDGNLPIPVAMFLIGAGIDFTTQLSVNIIIGQSFFDAIGNVDVTSVVKSGVTSALLGPMSSKGLKIGVTVITGATDAAADVNIDGTIKYLGGEGECKKELFEAGVDFTANILPGFVKHSPKLSSTRKYSTPEAVGKDWTEQELNATTEILFNVSAKALNEHFRTEKNKQMKNNRPQIVEPNDAIQVNPTPYPDSILNKRGFYEKLF